MPTAPGLAPQDIPLSVDEIDFGNDTLWEQMGGWDQWSLFAKLRAERPVSWHTETGIEGFPAGPGYWSLVKHADVWAAGRDAETFSSEHGGTQIFDMPEGFAEYFGSMINIDDPRHTRLRRIVSKAFTPRMVARIEEHILDVTTSIIDRVGPMGECDLVAEISAPLPLTIICDMMDIPEADRPRVFELTNFLLSGGDPEFMPDLDAVVAQALSAGAELNMLAQELARHRRDHRGEDLISELASYVAPDGDRLTDQDIGSFFILLVAAGNETTRNAISHGLKAITDFPDQRTIWQADVDGVTPTAVEEIVRWATPVMHFRRTATRDVMIRDTKIEAGQKVVLWYISANRDEEVWEDPWAFDVRRDPNPHVGFGGGPHFCLGANLARRELSVMFQELFRRLPDIEATSEPDILQSPFIHGIKRMRCAFTPVA